MKHLKHFMLAAALLVGGTAFAGTLTEDFESVTLTDANGNPVANNWSYGYGLSNGWKVIGGTIYGSASAANYGLWNVNNTETTGSKSLEASYSASNAASVVITEKLSGEFKFWVRRTPDVKAGSVILYLAEEDGDTYKVTSTKLYENTSINNTWVQCSVDLGVDAKYVAINLVRAAIDDIEAEIYEDGAEKKAIGITAFEATTPIVNADASGNFRATFNVTVENKGNVALTEADNVTVSVVAPAEAEGEEDEVLGTSLPIVLDVNETKVVEVSFEGYAEEDFSATVNVRENLTNKKFGETATFSVQVAGARFSIDASGLQDYGFVAQNAEAPSKSFTITNTGNAAMTMGVELPEGYTATKTVMFSNNKGWDDLRAYYWIEGQENLMDWPGVDMTFVRNNDYGEGQYSIAIPVNAKVIFNSNGEQTVDIDASQTIALGYYLTEKNGEGKYEVGTWNEPSQLNVAMTTEAAGLKAGALKLTTNALDVKEYEMTLNGYVYAEGVEHIDFAAMPEGWEVTGNTSVEGGALSFTYNLSATSYNTLTSPAIEIAEGNVLAIRGKKDSQYGELTVKGSADGGKTWSYTKDVTGFNQDCYVTVVVADIPATVTTLQLQGYYFSVDDLAGFTYNQNAPVLAVTPAENADFGKVMAEAKKTYTVSNKGTGKMTVNIASDSEDFVVEPAEIKDIENGTDATFTVTFKFDEKNLGEKSANITVTPTYNAEAAVKFTATATALDPNVWAEDFEDGQIPAIWENEGVWTVSTPTAAGNNGTQMATISSYNNPKALTTPRLEATKDAELKFYIGMQYTDEPLTIEYSNDDKATWNKIEEGVDSYTASGDITFKAPADGFYYVRFTGTYAMLDNFNGFKLGLKDHEVALSELTVGEGNQYVEMTAKVNVTEKVGKEETLKAQLFVNGEKYGEAVEKTVAAFATESFELTYMPTEAGDVKFYVVVSNDDLSLTSNEVETTVNAALVLDETMENEFEAKTYPSIVLNYTVTKGWNTIALPFAVNDLSVFGEGVKAYNFTGYVNGGLEFKTVTSLSSAKSYLLYVETAATEPIIFKNVNVTRIDNYTYADNVYFRGTYAPMEAGSLEGKYGVTSEGKIMKGNASATMDAFRAYFELPEGATARLVVDGETVTGINGIFAAEQAGGVYNLNGQKVVKAQKGLYIIGGKKVVVK